MAVVKTVPDGAELVEITEVISAGLFWVTAYGEAAETWSKPRAHLDTMEMFLAIAKLTVAPKFRTPRINEVVAVKHPQTGKWHRGRVHAIKDVTKCLYCVFLIDYGCTIEVSASDIRDIDEHYMKQEALAYQILLFGIVPSSDEPASCDQDCYKLVEWSGAANTFIRNLIAQYSIGYFSKKGEHVKNVVFGELYLVAEEGFLNLGMLLCIQKYALTNIHLFMERYRGNSERVSRSKCHTSKSVTSSTSRMHSEDICDNYRQLTLPSSSAPTDYTKHMSDGTLQQPERQEQRKDKNVHESKQFITEKRLRGKLLINTEERKSALQNVQKMYASNIQNDSPLSCDEVDFTNKTCIQNNRVEKLPNKDKSVNDPVTEPSKFCETKPSKKYYQISEDRAIGFVSSSSSCSRSITPKHSQGYSRKDGINVSIGSEQPADRGTNNKRFDRNVKKKSLSPRNFGNQFNSNRTGPTVFDVCDVQNRSQRKDRYSVERKVTCDSGSDEYVASNERFMSRDIKTKSLSPEKTFEKDRNLSKRYGSGNVDVSDAQFRSQGSPRRKDKFSTGQLSRDTTLSVDATYHKRFMNRDEKEMFVSPGTSFGKRIHERRFESVNNGMYDAQNRPQKHREREGKIFEEHSICSDTKPPSEEVDIRMKSEVGNRHPVLQPHREPFPKSGTNSNEFERDSTCDIANESAKNFEGNSTRRTLQNHDKSDCKPLSSFRCTRKARKSSPIRTFFPAGFNMAEADKLFAETISPRMTQGASSHCRVLSSCSVDDAKNHEFSFKDLKVDGKSLKENASHTSDGHKYKVESKTASGPHTHSREKNINVGEEMSPVVCVNGKQRALKDKVLKNIFDSEDNESASDSSISVVCRKGQERKLLMHNDRENESHHSSMETYKDNESLLCTEREMTLAQEIQAETLQNDIEQGLHTSDLRRNKLFSKLTVNEQKFEVKQMQVDVMCGETVCNEDLHEQTASSSQKSSTLECNSPLSPEERDDVRMCGETVCNEDVHEQTASSPQKSSTFKCNSLLSPEERLFSALKDYFAESGCTNVNESNSCASLLNQLLASLSSVSQTRLNENLKVKREEVTEGNDAESKTSITDAVTINDMGVKMHIEDSSLPEATAVTCSNIPCMATTEIQDDLPALVAKDCHPNVLKTLVNDSLRTMATFSDLPTDILKEKSADIIGNVPTDDIPIDVSRAMTTDISESLVTEVSGPILNEDVDAVLRDSKIIPSEVSDTVNVNDVEAAVIEVAESVLTKGLESAPTEFTSAEVSQVETEVAKAKVLIEVNETMSEVVCALQTELTETALTEIAESPVTQLTELAVSEVVESEPADHSTSGVTEHSSPALTDLTLPVPTELVTSVPSELVLYELTECVESASTECAMSAMPDLSEHAVNKLTKSPPTGLTKTASTELTESATTELAQLAATQLNKSAVTECPKSGAVELSLSAATDLQFARIDVLQSAGTKLLQSPGSELIESGASEIPATVPSKVSCSLNVREEPASLKISKKSLSESGLKEPNFHKTKDSAVTVATEQGTREAPASTPSHRIINVKPNPCTSLGFNHGRNIMDQLQLMIVLLHGAPKDFRHLNNVTDAVLRRDVHEILRTIMNRLMRMQKYAWPLIQQGHSCVLVGPPMSGKTLGYVVPLMDQMLQRVQNDQIPSGNGSVMLVLCSGSRSCIQIQELCYKFLQKSTKALKILVAYGGGADKIKFKLTNGCHILISTPRCFKRLLGHGKYVMDFLRLKFLVLDEADVLTLRFLPEIEFICKNIQHAMKSQDKAQLQVVAVAEKWCPGLEGLVQSLPNPVVCIGAFLEALVYAHLKPHLHFVTQKNNIAIVQDIIERTATSHHTLVVCREVTEVEDVCRALESYPRLIMVHHNMDTRDIHDLYVKWSWMEHPVLVCTDVILQELSFEGATQLVQFSLSDLSRRDFTFRCSTLIDQLSSMFESMVEKEAKIQPQMHIFISDEDSQPLPTILHLLKRVGVTIDPDLQKRANIAEVEKEIKKDCVPLCYNTKAFGDCWNRAKCNFRHIISNADKPRNIPTNGTVKVKILQVHDACNFSARILEHVNENGDVTTVPNLLMKISKKLLFYFKDETHRIFLEKPKAYDLCVVKKHGGAYERAEVLAIVKVDRNENPTELLIRFIDDGSRILIKAEKLFVLPEDLQEIPPQSVELFLCRLVPCDLDWNWGLVTNEKVATILSEAVTEGRFLAGKIKLSLGHTIWLDPLECYETLPLLKTCTIVYSLGRKLLDEQLAVENPQHLQLLYQACARAGLDVANSSACDTSLQIERSEEKVDICWAHLPTDEFSLVYFIVGDHPGRFYVRQQKFEDLVHKLDKKLSKIVKEKGSTDRTLFTGDYCIGKFTKDGRWYRARIENAQDDSLDLFFVDHGDRSSVSRSEAVPLPEDLISQLPFQAIECCLAGVGPDLGDRWSEQSIDALYDITAKAGTIDDVKLLYAKVLDKVKPADYTGGSKYHVALIEVTPHGQAFLNNTLVAWQLATQSEEQKLLLEGLDINHLTPPNDVEPSDESEEDDELDKNGGLQSLDAADIIFEGDWNSEQQPEQSILESDVNTTTLSCSLDTTSSTDSCLEATFPSFDFSAITENEIMEFFEQTMEEYNTQQSKQITSTPLSRVIVEEEKEEDCASTTSRALKSSEDCEKEESERVVNEQDMEDQNAQSVCSYYHSCNENMEDNDTSSASEDDYIIPLLGRTSRVPLVYWRQNAYFVWLRVDLPGVENYHLKWDVDHLHFWTVVENLVYTFDLNLYGSIYPHTLTHSGGLFVQIKMQKVLVGVEWLRLVINPEKLSWVKRDFDAENFNDIDELHLSEQLRAVKEMERKKEKRIERAGLLPADEAPYEDDDSNSSCSDVVLHDDEQYDPYDPLN